MPFNNLDFDLTRTHLKDFVPSSFVSEILLSHSSRAKLCLLQLDSQIRDIHLRIASNVTTYHCNLTTKITGLRNLCRVVQDLNARMQALKVEAGKCKESCVKEYFKLRKYFFYII